jgi:hypothetical protein
MNYGLGLSHALVVVLLLGCSTPERDYGPAEAGAGGEGASSGSGGGNAGTSHGGKSSTGGSNAVAGDGGEVSQAGDGPGAHVCTPHERRCSDSGIPQECDAEGSGFVDQAPCTGDQSICDSDSGECIGPCEPDTQRCTSLQVIQDCDAQGLWQNNEQCPFACLESGGAASCGGSCKPGERTCGAEQTPYLCDDSGTPQPQDPCMNVCSGAGKCSGDCSPTDTRCSTTMPGGEEVCTAEGTWGEPSTCTFVCDDIAGACGGECKPGSANQCSGKTVQSCQADGTWKNEQDCGSLPCTGGVCKACTPDTKQCNAGKPQTCSAGGDWVDDQASACPFVCNAASGTCAGECVPSTDACFSGTSKRCGTDGLYNAGTVCPYICDSSTGKCGGACKPNTKQCTGNTSQTCSSAGQWGQDTACQYGCNTGTGACNTCTDEAVATTCAGNKCGSVINNCGKSVTCPGCSDGKYCNGTEMCVSNQCQPAAAGPCTVTDATNCVPTCTEGASAAVCGVTGKDTDNDGHKTNKCVAAPGDDCDDSKGTVYTGATEMCDGLDNDCDNKLDVADGVPLLNASVEVGPTANTRSQPEISWAPESSLYGIAYEDDSATTKGVYFTAINQAGAEQKAPVNVGSESNGYTLHLVWGTDNFGLTWFDSSLGNVRFRTVGSNGSVGVIREIINGSMAKPQVARIGTGNWAVSYLDFGDGFGYFGAKTVSATGTIGSHVSLAASASNYGLLVGTASGFATTNEVSSDGTAQASIFTSSLGSPASLSVAGNSPIMGAGPSGFAIAVEKASAQPEFYSFDGAGNASCGPVKFGDASFVPSDLVGTANGYLVVSSGSTVRAQQIKADCSLGQLFTVDAAAGDDTRVSGGASGYGVVWYASGKVKRRFFGPKFCD